MRFNKHCNVGEAELLFYDMRQNISCSFRHDNISTTSEPKRCQADNKDKFLHV